MSNVDNHAPASQPKSLTNHENTKGHPPVVKQIINSFEKSFPPLQFQPDRRHPLLCACKRKNYQDILDNLNRGDNMVTNEYGQNIFHYLAVMKASRYDPKLVKQTLCFLRVCRELTPSCRKNLFKGKDINSRTPLHVAARYAAFVVIQMAHYDGADTNARDFENKIPLQTFMAAAGHLQPQLQDRQYWRIQRLLASSTSFKAASSKRWSLSVDFVPDKQDPITRNKNILARLCSMARTCAAKAEGESHV
ncbi:MAG: hypothetical protein M1834_009754 [Cirrosporium novae-zelandiae]|nr:MAG: hypothetical protein M1834_009754 [Cirrosporium novae-zelandiae]